MGYKGQTLAIRCDQGGFSYNQNTDLLTPNQYIIPSRNFNLHEGGRHKRGGTAKINGSAGYGNGRIMGGIDFQLPTNSYQVVLSSDGGLYKNSTTTLKTGMATAHHPSFAVFGTQLFVCDGQTLPQIWDGVGAGTTGIAHPAPEWTGTNQPIQCISHGANASRRVWYLLGNVLSYSALNDGGNVTGGGQMTIDTGDAFGLVGMIEWQNRIIAFSRTKSFIIDDTDPDIANWGWAPAAWSGGAAHWRLMVLTQNDLIVMAPDGEVYSVGTVQAYGDYKRASVSRPSFVDNFIRDKMDVTTVEDWHMSFDPTLRAIFIFMRRQGITYVDTAAVFFIDRAPEGGWTIHDNQAGISGYWASCSFPVRTATTNYVLYTGGYTGFVWALNQATRSDDGLGFYGGFRTPVLSFDNPRVLKHFKRVFVVAKTSGAYNLQVSVWVDGVSQPAGTISLAGQGGVLGVGQLGTFILGGADFVNQVMDLGYRGKRLQLEFFNSGTGQDFFISQVLVDFRLMGVRPQ